MSSLRQRWQQRLDEAVSAGDGKKAAFARDRLASMRCMPNQAVFDEDIDANPRKDGTGPEYCECDAETHVCSCEPVRLGRRDADVDDDDVDDDSFAAAMKKLDAAEASGAMPSGIVLSGTREQSKLFNARWDAVKARLDNRRADAAESRTNVDERELMIARRRAMASAKPAESERVDGTTQVPKVDAADSNDPALERERMIARRRAAASSK
jgi:hypothetical protein